MQKIFLGCLCLLLFFGLSVGLVPQVRAEAESKSERAELLKQKLLKLQQLLAQVEEARLKEQPPTETPWQPIQAFGEERPAYDQYAYLLAPHLRKADLDSALQQLHYLAGLDELKERGNLFVVPALPLAVGETMAVERYNRELAAAYLRTVGLPSAYEGWLVVSPDPLHQAGVAAGPLLMIDLAGCDQIMRTRIFDLLLKVRLFTEDGSVHSYLWQLLQNASPQVFKVSMEGPRLILAVETD
ncbi:MAG TPA: hypothetical protein VIR78_09045 [Malonomonas sp.]